MTTPPTSPQLKIEETTARIPLSDGQPADVITPRRSWSTGMMNEYSKRNPSLPDLLSAANRVSSRRQERAYQAAVRATAGQLQTPKLRATRTASEESRSTAGLSNGTRHLASPPVAFAQTSSSSPLASGPAAGLQQQPGTHDTIRQIHHRYTQQSNTLPIYLIRTDLRYAPTLDTVTVYMELPGLRLENVNLKIGNHSNGIKQLVVTAISRPPTNSRDQMAMQERCFGIFTRTLVVPPHVQASDIKAEMSNGLLVLLIPGTKFESIPIHAQT